MRTYLLDTTTTSTTTSISTSTAAVAAVGQRSPWHSPVPYLFGGLAAMLGLIAFALLILACSYWRLSRSSPQNEEEDGDLEKGDGVSKINGSPVYEEKIVVIMAGEHNPTFLATPTFIFSSKPKNTNTNTNTNNFDDVNVNVDADVDVDVDDDVDDDEDKVKNDDDDDHHSHHQQINQ